ncbi:lysophospholipid acyltransferase family protein [Chitinimonas naiadis]
MISVAGLLSERFPAFNQKPLLVRKLIIGALRVLLCEKQINDFMHYADGHTGLDFNDCIVQYLNVRYGVHGQAHIPATGPVVIVANHPLGALDGSALIQLVSQVRKDVRMVVSDVLLQFRPARDILLPVDNLSGRSNRGNVDGIDAALARGEVVIIFPSGEVSRATPRGIRDGIWRTGFLRVAARARAPILPVHIGGRNSLGFYAWSMLYKPMAMLLLAREIFGNHSVRLPIVIDQPIAWEEVEAWQLSQPAAAARLRQHVYRLRPGRRTHRALLGAARQRAVLP